MSTPAYPSADESFDRLRRAGWSFGYVGGTEGWQVSRHNGENLRAAGATLAEAAWRACEQARAVGMLAPPREG